MPNLTIILNFGIKICMLKPDHLNFDKNLTQDENSKTQLTLMLGKVIVTMKPKMKLALLNMKLETEMECNVKILSLSKCPVWIVVVILEHFGAKIVDPGNAILALYQIQMKEKNYVKVYNRKCKLGMFVMPPETEICVQMENVFQTNLNQGDITANVIRVSNLIDEMVENVSTLMNVDKVFVQMGFVEIRQGNSLKKPALLY